MNRYIILVISVLTFAACSSSNTSSHKQTPEEIAAQRQKDSLALKIGVRQTIDCLPAFVAADDGICDSLGVDVRLWHFSSMLDCNEALKNKKLNGAFTDVKRVEYLNNRYALGLQSMKRFDTRWQLMANKMSRLQSVKQLKEKMVAMSRNSATDYLCDRMADSVRLGSDKLFRIQINDVDLRLKMLLNNELDAVWLTEPQATVARNRGANMLMESGRNGEKLEVLAFTGKSVNDARVKRQMDLFLRAYDIACRKIEKGGERYYKYLVEKYYKYKL